MGIRPTLKAVRVPFGERGLKIRAVSAGLAGFFLLFALGGDALLELLLPGARWMSWAFIVLAALVMFFRVYRSDEEGEVDIMFIHALMPLWLIAPGLLYVFIMEDVPHWGSWNVLGRELSGGSLYWLLLLYVFVYNLFRLNISKSLRARR
jgi:uncharacterized membrane protein